MAITYGTVKRTQNEEAEEAVRHHLEGVSQLGGVGRRGKGAEVVDSIPWLYIGGPGKAHSQIVLLNSSSRSPSCSALFSLLLPFLTLLRKKREGVLNLPTLQLVVFVVCMLRVAYARLRRPLSGNQRHAAARRQSDKRRNAYCFDSFFKGCACFPVSLDVSCLFVCEDVYGRGECPWCSFKSRRPS